MVEKCREKTRFRCCFNGQALDENSAWPKLKPLSKSMRVLIYGKEGAVGFINDKNELDSTHYPENNIAHMSRNSARYYGIFSISATGVENGKGGGWEKIIGAHGGDKYLFSFLIICNNNHLFYCSKTQRTDLPLYAKIQFNWRNSPFYYG